MLQGIFMYFMRQTIIVMSRHIEYDLKNVVFDHYQRLTQRFFKRNNTGDLMNRISEDVGKVRMYVGPAIMYALNTLCAKANYKELTDLGPMRLCSWADILIPGI